MAYMLLKQILALVSLISIVSSQHCRRVRYMPIGDSITDIVCWRAYLWELLMNSGYANVDFVGTNRRDNGCNVLSYDRDGEGHSGYLASHILALNLLPAWLQENPTDIVTIHLGSNDISHGYETEAILDAFSGLVGQLREANPEMKIIVAQLIPIHIGSFETAVLELNSRIPLWAASMSTKSSPIWVVDQHSDFGREDLRDGLHPNEAGDRKMAGKWFPAVVEAIKSIHTEDFQRNGQKQLGFEL